MAIRFWPGLGDAMDRKAPLPDQVSDSPVGHRQQNTLAGAGPDKSLAADAAPEPVKPAASAFGPRRPTLQPVVVSATPVVPLDLAAYSPAVTPALIPAPTLSPTATVPTIPTIPIPLASIRFAFDSAVLSAAGRAQVAEAAIALGRADTGTPVTVTGFADTVGSDDYNLQLSRRRAAAVAAALSALGVPRDRMQVLGRGSEAAPAGGGSDDGEEGGGSERMVWVELGTAPQGPVASRSDAPVTPFTDR